MHTTSVDNVPIFWYVRQSICIYLFLFTMWITCEDLLKLKFQVICDIIVQISYDKLLKGNFVYSFYLYR